MRIFRKFFIFIIFSILIVACDAGGNPDSSENITRAKLLVEKTEFQSALIELKNALNKDPGNGQARFLLGQIYITLGEGASAEKELGRARKLGISEEETQLLLAESLLLQAKYQEVLDLKPVSGSSMDSQAVMHALRGTALLELRQLKAANGEFDHALGIDENNLKAVVGMAKLAAYQGDLDRAHRQLENAFAINQNDAVTWSLLADIERSAGNLEAAVQAYTRAAENRVANSRDLINRSLVYIELKQYANAEIDIKQLKNRRNGPIGIIYAEGLLYFHQQRYADAQTAFEKVLTVSGNFLPAIYYLGTSHFMQAHHEQATDYLTRVVYLNPRQIPALKMLATLNLRNGNYSEAERLITPVVEQYPEDTFALNLLGSALTKDNKINEGVGYFQKIVELQPDSAIAHSNLGLVLLQDGKTRAGISELEESMSLQPDDENASVKVILIHLQNKSFDEALRAALDYREKHQQNARAHFLVGAAYLGSGDAANAAKALERVLLIEPGNLAASNALAAIAIESNLPDKARRYYQKALKKHPQDLSTLTSLALLEAAEEKEAAMIAAFEQAIKFHPQVLAPRQSLARYFSRLGKADKVIEILSPMRSVYPNNPNVMAMLGESELAVRNYRQAVSDLERLVVVAPTNIWARFTLAQAYAAIKDNDRVRSELNKVVQLDENHTAARIMLVKILLAGNNTNEAGPHIEVLTKQAPGQAEVLLLEAKQAELTGNTQKTIALYQQLFDTQKSNFNLLLLEKALWKAGKKTRATKLLEEWLTEYTEDYLILIQLARRNLDQGQEEKAIATYKRVLEISPDNIIALNNLAWHLRETDHVQAVEYGEKAYSLAPDSDVVIDTLALALSKTDVALAQKMILRALDKKPGNPTYLYHQAQILKTAGNTRQAVKILKSLLEKDSDFPEREEAKKMLKDLRPGLLIN